MRGKGIVLDEPSIVAMNTNDGRLLAVGAEAKRMLGRTPGHIEAVRPLKDGVIADFDICEKMLRYFIQRVHQRKWAKPRMVICIPSGITGVERRAVQEAAEFAGARKPVLVIEEPMAAAIGSGLPVHEPAGNMIVDIGGGTTEVAVISLGGIVVSESSRVGGDEFDEAIINFVKREYSLALGERTAEEVKVQLASAWPLEEEIYAEVRGRDLVTGLPKTIVISTVEIREAIEEPTAAIVDAVKVTLDKTPPELAADIMEQGHRDHRWRRAAHRARERDPGRDRDARAPGEAPAVLGGARLRPVPRELRCAPAGPELRPAGLTAPSRREVVVVVYRQDRRRRLTLVLLVDHLAGADLARRAGLGGGRLRRGPRRRTWSRRFRTWPTIVVDPVADFFDSLGRADELEAENARLRRQLAAAQGEVASAKRAAVAEHDSAQGGRSTSRRIDDFDGIVATRHRWFGRQLPSHVADRQGHRAPGIAKDMPVVVGGERWRTRRAGCDRSRATARSCDRLDDRDFGVGVQLVQNGASGPVGRRARVRRTAGS